MSAVYSCVCVLQRALCCRGNKRHHILIFSVALRNCLLFLRCWVVDFQSKRRRGSLVCSPGLHTAPLTNRCAVSDRFTVSSAASFLALHARYTSLPFCFSFYRRSYFLSFSPTPLCAATKSFPARPHKLSG